MNPSTHLLKEKLGLRQLVGATPCFLEQIQTIPKIAACDVSVLITGETGTGKELVARAIHYLSHRSDHPFVPVNCGAIPVDLIENELFGHEEGAFTNACTSKGGLIHECNGGTLLLDEVDCLSRVAQVKLLRFLQEGEFRPLGSQKIKKADVRVLAATNTDVDKALANEALRRDLYFRLNVVQIHLPPLRDRRADIPPLANHFMKKYSDKFKKAIAGILPEAMQMLLMYNWPGNVRELENIIERAIVLCEDSVIGADAVLFPRQKYGRSFREVKSQLVVEFEKSFIQDLLLVHQGNLLSASKAAQTSRRTLERLVQKYHLSVPSV